MERFTEAFRKMFDTLAYSHIENKNNHKDIIFKKYGKNIAIDELSSDEKQIVYRGCFLLKDAHALDGAFVFIDEPEISLHPSWQMKVMDYYKGIFTNADGKQTSQIFVVTHSPFIIHNDNRRNDKVIVLSRDTNGKICVKQKQEYFKCYSNEVVEDAFNLHNFSTDHSAVYLEGRTDEKYFKKTVEIFNMDVPFESKWVGYQDERGQEVNTGDKSVDKAFHFLVAQNLPIINICLKDSDTHREMKSKNNVIAASIPKYENPRHIEKGIENALILDAVDLKKYYNEKIQVGPYGEQRCNPEFMKMKLCNDICEMGDEAKPILTNLKKEIEVLVELYNKESKE